MLESDLPNKETIREGSVLLIDKPYTWTSFDAINKIKRLAKAKIGHCGTLDPLATGLLICCTGKMTKSISQYQKLPKEYTGVITIGANTPTYDLESEPTNFQSFEQITEDQIHNAKDKFIGRILQTPPIHSAIKKDGKRAYELARAGKDIKLAPREIQIDEFEILKINLPEIHFKVNCSTGTYIRSLANDLGEELGCGAYLSQLRRTKIGDFHVEQAKTILEWVDYLNEDEGVAAV